MMKHLVWLETVILTLDCEDDVFRDAGTWIILPS